MQSSIPIAKPPWTNVGKKLESQVRKALYDFEMLKEVKKLAIALSGGKDSLSLLYMLKAISGRGFAPIELYAVNVAGEFTCGASIGRNFLQTICDELEVPLVFCESTKTLENLECYGCSRERRKLLFDAAKNVGCHHIAFGHHQDDSAETLLMNLLHKGEFCSLLPKIYMVDYDITILRPLIYVPEDAIRSFATLHGFNRITCKCPVGQTSLRKKTDDLIRDMEELYPNARANLARAGLVYGSKKAQKQVNESIL